jgi:DNA-binding MarR family transcriptional regulator
MARRSAQPALGPGADHLDHEVLTLARLARLLERACARACEPPVTLAQYRLLAMIDDGAHRASDLAGRLALAKPTVSATVDTLVERGFVSRATAPDDRRATRLSVTPDGQAALRSTEAAMRDRLDDLLGRVDDPTAVQAALGALAESLDERREERRAARERA